MRIRPLHIALPVVSICLLGWVAIPTLDGATLIRLDITQGGHSVLKAQLTCRSRSLDEILGKLTRARFETVPGAKVPATGVLDGRVSLWIQHVEPLRKCELDRLTLTPIPGAAGSYRLDAKEVGRVIQRLPHNAGAVTLRTAQLFHQRMVAIATSTRFTCFMSSFRPARGVGLQRHHENTGISWVFQPPPKQPGMASEVALIVRLERAVRPSNKPEAKSLGRFDHHPVILLQQNATVGGDGTTTEALLDAIKKALSGS